MTPKVESKILIGYEVGTGKPVHMTPKHTMITGMTGDAGKTTAVLGLASRWEGQKFVVFKTKIGEDVFEGYRTIPPYFKEQKATWQSIEALIEASQGEKIKIIRTTLMKVCEGASTIEQVFGNVAKKMAELDKKGRGGFDYDMLYQVREYLRQVLAELGKHKFADKLELADGINVVDLTEMAAADNGAVMIAMIVGATAEEILKRHNHTSLVVPEAWQVIPGDRKSPATPSVEALIRQGRVQNNYVVIDSQDIAGVNTKVRRHIANYLLGKQGDEHEVERTLKAISLPPKQKPRADEIQTLKKGQFFAVINETVTKVYSRPAWMEELQAVDVAKFGMRGDRDAQVVHMATTAAETLTVRTHESYGPSWQEFDNLKSESEKLKRQEQFWKDLHGEVQKELRSVIEAKDALEGELAKLNALKTALSDVFGNGIKYAVANSDGEMEVGAEDVEVVVHEKLREEKLDESTYEGKVCILLADKLWTTTISKGALEDLLTQHWGTSWSGNTRKALSAALDKLSQRPYSLITSNSHGWTPTEKGKAIRKEQIAK